MFVVTVQSSVWKDTMKLFHTKGSLWPMAYMVDAVIRLCSMFRFRLPGGWRSVVLYILNLTWNILDWAERIGRKYSQQCQGWLPGLCLATPWLYYYTFALISFCRDLIFYYKEGCVGLPQLCLPDWWVMSVIGQGWGIILIALSGAGAIIDLNLVLVAVSGW